MRTIKPTYLQHVEEIVSMVAFEGRLYVATNKRVFRTQGIKDQRQPALVELNFVTEENTP